VANVPPPRTAGELPGAIATMSDQAGLKFGDFTLDVAERLLLREGHAVPLTPKAFDVLAALAARPGRLVTKDELLKEIWPDAFVEESNLAYHVFALRRALGDTAEGHCYVETVPKRGYRFVGTVVTDEGSGGDASTEGKREGVSSGRPSRKTALWAAGACGAAAILVLLLLYTHAQRPPLADEPTKVEVSSSAVRLSLTSTFTISPDGRRLVFAGAGADGVTRLWVRNLDENDARPLPGTEVALGQIVPPTFWSPDSRFVAFDASGQLKKIDVTGGPPQTVCALSDLAVGGSWNQEGVIVVGSPRGGISRCPASGGSASIVTEPDAALQQSAHLLPWFLPDGRRFLYLAVSRTVPGNSGIYVHALDAPPGSAGSTRILDARFGAAYVPGRDDARGHLLFLRDGVLFAQGFDPAGLHITGPAARLAEPVGHFLDGAFFSASTNGTLAFRPPEGLRRLTWLDRQGNVLGHVGEAGRYSGLALAPGEQRAVVVQHGVGANVDQDLWVIDLPSGRSSRITFDARLEAQPLWFADGKRIIFSTAGTVGSLFEQPVGGGQDPRMLLDTPQHNLAEDVSPDGRFLLFTVQNIGGTRNDVWVLPLTGDRPPYPFIRRDFDQGQARFSPDGRWVAYVSSESGRQEVRVRRFAPNPTGDVESDSDSVPVSTSGGVAPRWRRDGRELFFITPDGAIAVADVHNGDALEIGTPKRLFQAPDVSFDAPAGVPSWSVSADGTRFLVALTEPRTVPTSFLLVFNWQAGLAHRQ
jgi:DNA-binding winged helix-turn-helix (wHTH) protein/Tol biopolymer transport system component